MKKLLLSAAAAIVSISSLQAQMPGWTGYTPITLTENSGSDLFNYQMELTFDSEAYVLAGDMLANGDDIRFTELCSGGTNYSYWIESGMNTTTTKVWVKIDALLANSTKTIYMQYGNPSASSASAVMGTFIGPHSATDSVVVGSAGGVANSQRGFRFAPNEDLLVTSFGKYEPTGTQRYITLFNFGTQAIEAQTQVAGPAGSYSYGDLTAPVWLTSGTQYTLQLFQGAGDGYYFGTSSQIGQHMTYYDMRYCNSCTQNTFPTSTLSNYHYGFPDLWYYTRNTATVTPSFNLGSAVNFTADLVDSLLFCEGDTLMVASAITGTAPFLYSWSGIGVINPTDSLLTAIPTASGYYYLTVTNVCTDHMDSVYVTVNPSPSGTIQSSSPVLCYGESADLSIVLDPGVSALWSDGITTGDTYTVTPSSPTQYSVTLTGSNGCQYTATYLQDVNPMIDTTVTESQLTGALTVAEVGAQYQWVDCNNGNAAIAGATSATYQPTVNGSYAVEVTSNGCTVTSNCHEISNVSVLELDGNEFLSVVPNPNNGTFEIRSTSSQKLVLTDATGKVIQTIEVLGGVAKFVDLKGAANGIYFLSTAHEVLRIVVQ